MSEIKKASERISEMREHIASNEMFTPSFALLSGIGQAHASLTAATRYLDEEQARRAAFESSVLARLAAVERKTSSEHVVEVTEVIGVGPDFNRPRVGIAGVTSWPSIEQGRTMRLRWVEPEPQPSTATGTTSSGAVVHGVGVTQCEPAEEIDES